MTDELFSQNLAEAKPVTVSRVDPALTRWILCAGTTMAPSQFKAMPSVPFGGVHLGHQYKTLALTNYLIRRCQLTPMVEATDWINPDLLGGDYNQPHVVTQKSFELTFDSPAMPDYRREIERVGYRVYPGHELTGLLALFSGADDIGIREVEFLRGTPVPRRMPDGSLTPCRAFEIQTEIFPEWASYVSGELPFFATTDALHNYLTARLAQVEAEDTAAAIELMIDSNTAFESWAIRHNDAMARLVQAPVTESGRRYSFTELNNHFFDLCNLNREEFLTKRTASAVAASAGNGSTLPANVVTQEELLKTFQMFAETMFSRMPNAPAAPAPATEDAPASDDAGTDNRRGPGRPPRQN